MNRKLPKKNKLQLHKFKEKKIREGFLISPKIDVKFLKKS